MKNFKDMNADDLHKLVDGVRQGAKDHPDYVYQEERSTNDEGEETFLGCLYRSTQQNPMGCIVGNGFAFAGIERTPSMEDCGIKDLLRRVFGYSASANVAQMILWLNMVQNAQDQGKPWGEAVEEADKLSPLP